MDSVRSRKSVYKDNEEKRVVDSDSEDGVASLLWLIYTYNTGFVSRADISTLPGCSCVREERGTGQKSLL